MFERKSILIALIAIATWMFLAWYFEGLLPNFVCPLKYMTNITCPFCGLTRSFHFLFCGEIKAAVLMNPLIVILICFQLMIFVGFISKAFLSCLERSKKYIYVFLQVSIYLTWIYLIIRHSAIEIV